MNYLNLGDTVVDGSVTHFFTGKVWVQQTPGICLCLLRDQVAHTQGCLEPKRLLKLGDWLIRGVHDYFFTGTVWISHTTPEEGCIRIVDAFDQVSLTILWHQNNEAIPS